MVITVHEVTAPKPNAPHTIELTIRPNANASAGLADGNPPENEALFVRPESHQQQLEVATAQGHAIPWYPSGMDTEAGRLTVTLTAAGDGISATELRYYTLVRASAEVPFEFSGVTMP